MVVKTRQLCRVQMFGHLKPGTGEQTCPGYCTVISAHCTCFGLLQVQDELVDVLKVCASARAFAAIRLSGSVVTWGDVDCGGDSSAVQTQLQDIQEVCASQQAFAAIRADGGVVTWGHADRGGNSSKVKEQLHDIRMICPSQHAFAAVRGDATVVTWGPGEHGGDCHAVMQKLAESKT